MIRILTIVAVLCHPCLCYATCVRARVIAAPVVVSKAVVANVVATTFVPVQIPAYQVSYDPARDAEFARLKLEVEALKLRLQILQQQQAQPMPKAGEDDLPKNSVGEAAIKILTTHCAACHTGQGAKKSFQIFTAPGQLNREVHRGKIYLQAHNGTMPKDKDPLSDKDVDILREWLAN